MKKVLHFMILVMLVHANMTAAKPMDNVFSGLIEIKHGFIIIECSINGEIGNFILDSGAPGLILNTQSHLDKHEQNRTFVGINSDVSTGEIFVKSFQWQGMNRRNILATSIDFSLLEKALRMPIAGLIGFDIFKGYFININFESNSITISKSENLGQRSYFDLRMLPNRHLSVVMISNQGVNLKLALDTGSNSNLLDASIVRDHFNDAMQIGTINLRGASMESIASRKLAIENLEIGDKAETTNFVVTDMTVVNEHLDYPIDGILGQEFLSNYNLVIDKKQRFIRFYEMDDTEAVVSVSDN